MIIKVGTGIMSRETFAKLSGITLDSVRAQIRKGFIKMVKTGETKQSASYVNCLDWALKLAQEAQKQYPNENIVIEIANVDNENFF